MYLRALSLLLLVQFILPSANAQHTVARQWNDVLLDAIRTDFARPTIHARNLFHSSVAMYDAWAAFDETATPFLLGQTVAGYTCSFAPITPLPDLPTARETAISYAAYRLLKHRFEKSPGRDISLPRIDSLFQDLGHDASFTSIDYAHGSAAALGNYIAACLIDFGLEDGSHERFEYGSLNYRTVNVAMVPTIPGNESLSDPNRWQPLSLDFVDQAGNPIPIRVPRFLSPEWGDVTPFALKESDVTFYERERTTYKVYHDPGPPPYITPETGGGMTAEYAWGFALVALWSSHLDPADSVMVDISPAGFGNLDIARLPRTIEGLRAFFDDLEGGDISEGHRMNPHTGSPYEPQLVPRGDYTRVLAEFWADGPDSETPPGHWFTILNYVNDHPDFEKRFRGEGEVMNDLEWDVKAYLTLGGAVHDAAIAAWGIKGWYDYIRPISAIRWMADQGQSSDSTLTNFAHDGIPLVPGFIETVLPGDELAGTDDEHVGKIKLYAWRGPDYITEPEIDVAGVGWILAENWWPYQRPTFITPPFAGYISGHSTFSRAAAEVMTLLTGDPFFPGGMGEFIAPKNEFLVFEDGPSVDVTLQWATYRDASDQTSLSRIWGGIHPPADDIPGRLIGERVGIDAFEMATRYFYGQLPISNDVPPQALAATDIFPNPVQSGTPLQVHLKGRLEIVRIEVFNVLGQRLYRSSANRRLLTIETSSWAPGTYFVRIAMKTGKTVTYPIVISK